MNNNEKFLDSIKSTVIDNCTKNNICPSLVAALAAYISNWNTNTLSVLTNNLFNIPFTGIFDETYDKYYSSNTNKIYNYEQENDEIGSIYYRVYDSKEKSIIDFISYLVNTKRSKNGPYKYASLINCTDYKESINRLIRSGFMKDYLHKTTDNIVEIQNIIAIIENYKLYEWDNLLKEEAMSKKKRLYVSNNINENEVSEENNEIGFGAMESTDEVPSEEEAKEETHMYRVRLSWDKPDTQIFASPNYEDAKEEALKHEGYKIYIDDDGELFENPWDKKEEEQTSDGIIRGIISPSAGNYIILDNTPVYKRAADDKPFTYAKGKFYFYDHLIVKKRVKITTNENIKYDKKKNPSMIYGYIDIY